VLISKFAKDFGFYVHSGFTVEAKIEGNKAYLRC
jgi:hypothetical protein